MHLFVEILVWEPKIFCGVLPRNISQFGLIALTVSDRYASSCSYSRCLYVSHIQSPRQHFDRIDGSPSNHKEKHIKRITALPGDWISSPYAHDALKVPEGHCWVDGDNFASSLDSRSFGPKLLTNHIGRFLWVWFREELPTLSGLPGELVKLREEFLKMVPLHAESKIFT
ncbi:hypothetical protein HYC85_006484 [Camellia sinensis]|uniref:Mitochondrial inner membrane protease subunit 2 n=1 Tax=Camellia sinensis TaxID=4442 RepID=A0A7J7HNP7_CAMSI|nr:hypothetical protein HYC85_006484 [Camellia sinensis]